MKNMKYIYPISGQVFFVFSLFVIAAPYSHAKTERSKATPPLESFFIKQKKRSKPRGVSYNFSGDMDDSIGYAGLCIATDNTCGTCDAPYLNITSGTPAPYITS